jgi:hypothetical protein
MLQRSVLSRKARRCSGLCRARTDLQNAMPVPDSGVNVPHGVGGKRRLASTPKIERRMGSGPQHSHLLLSTGVLNPIGTGNAGVRSECNARYGELATSSISAHAMSSTNRNRLSVESVFPLRLTRRLPDNPARRSRSRQATAEMARGPAAVHTA